MSGLAREKAELETARGELLVLLDQDTKLKEQRESGALSLSVDQALKLEAEREALAAEIAKAKRRVGIIEERVEALQHEGDLARIGREAEGAQRLQTKGAELRGELLAHAIGLQRLLGPEHKALDLEWSDTVSRLDTLSRRTGALKPQIGGPPTIPAHRLAGWLRTVEDMERTLEEKNE